MSIQRFMVSVISFWNSSSTPAGSSRSAATSSGVIGVRVEAGVRDELVQPRQSGRVDDALAPEEVGGVLVGRLLDHRHDHLAGDVAAHHDGVDAVELPGVQELPQAHVGAVDVGGEEDLRVFHRGTSYFFG